MSSGRLIGQWEAHWEAERWWKDVLEKQVRSPYCVQAHGQTALYRVLNSVFVPASLWIWVNSRTLFPLTTIVCIRLCTHFPLPWSLPLTTPRLSYLFLSLVFSSFTPPLLLIQVQLSFGWIFLLIWIFALFKYILIFADDMFLLLTFNAPMTPEREKQ